MNVDELARQAARDVRSSARSMPLEPISAVRTRHRLALALPALATAAAVFVVVALLATPTDDAPPVVSPPTPTTVPVTPTTAPALSDAAVLVDLPTVTETRAVDFGNPSNWGLEPVGSAPWGRVGQGESGSGPSEMAVAPSGAVLVADRVAGQVLRLDDGDAVLASWDAADLVPVSVAATDRLVFVDGVTNRTGRPHDLVVLDYSGTEVARFEIGDLGGGTETTGLWLDDNTVYWVTWMAEGVMQTWKPVATTAGEPLSYVGPVSLGRPEADGGFTWMGGNTVARLYPDGRSVQWTTPDGYLVSTFHAFEDGVLVVYTAVPYGETPTMVVAALHPDTPPRVVAYDTSWMGVEPPGSIQVLTGLGLYDLGATASGIEVGRLPLDGLRTPTPVGAIDTTGLGMMGMDQFGRFYDQTGTVTRQTDSLAMSWKRVAWDGFDGIVYLDDDGALHRATPDGDVTLTGSLGAQEMVEILDVFDGKAAIATGFDTMTWVDLTTGEERVEGPAGRVDHGEGVFSLTAQGRRVRIDWPDWTNAARGEGGELIGDFALPTLVLEDAATGTELARYQIATHERPYVDISDFDGRRVIVTRVPYEPANPPMTVLVIDLECAECLTVTDVDVPVSWTLIGEEPIAGDPVTQTMP